MAAIRKSNEIFSTALIAKISFKSTLWFFVAFLFSYYLSDYYYLGDQLYYHAFYNEVNDFDAISEKYIFYKGVLDAAEPLYFAMVTFFSPFIEKNFLFSLINGALFGLLIFYVQKHGHSSLLGMLFLPNFYLMVLFFSAERLKVGLFLFVLAFLFSGIKRWMLFLAACASQFQMLFLVGAVVFWGLKDFKLNEKKYTFLIFLSAIALYFVFGKIDFSVFADHFESKYTVYADNGGWSALVKPLIFMIGSLVCVKKDRVRIFFFFLPILTAAYYLGSERLAIFGYFAMIYFALQGKMVGSAVLIASSLYFFYNGLGFISKFLTDGYFSS